MNRVAYPLEIGLSKELGHGRSRDSGRLRYKHGMVALLVTAAVVAVVLHIMVQESCLAANRTGRIALRSSINTLRRFRCPLIPTLLATILLMSMRIFSVAIKIRFVVALRAAYLIQFCHEDSSPFGRYVGLW